MRLIATMAAAIAMIWPLAGWAAEPEQLGKSADWTAYKYEDGGGLICYAVSEPKKQVGNYTQRGDVYLLVTHRPSGKVFDEVSVITGYTYKERSTPTATVSARGGNKSYNFYTEGDAAWVVETKEAELVQAMRAGNSMIVNGVSSRGTQTTDTYSLSGATKTLNTIDEACGRK